MATDIKIPSLGESVSEAVISKWLKQPGDTVTRDEPLVELETDKVTLELPAPATGILETVSARAKSTVHIGTVIGSIAAADAKNANPEDARTEDTPPDDTSADDTSPDDAPHSAPARKLSPAAAKLLAENKLDPATITATGPKGNITKADVLKALKTQSHAEPEPDPTPANTPAPPQAATAPPAPVFAPQPTRPLDPRGEERQPMSQLRKIIASRLKEAQNNAAMLTTFNDVNMRMLMDLRGQYRDLFEKKYQSRLGYMSFFVRAAATALREIPAVNAEIYGDEIIYKDYYDIGIAVGTGKGLVVPILRDADNMTIAEIETKIADFGKRARSGSLSIEEMTGGTFTITNGGVFGSLLSTPIINPPQSAILGMHKIQNRPVVIDDAIVAAPMMYLALSYDHRIIDGREAVTFLVRIKEMLEDPQRLLMEL